VLLQCSGARTALRAVPVEEVKRDPGAGAECTREHTRRIAAMAAVRGAGRAHRASDEGSGIAARGASSAAFGLGGSLLRGPHVSF